jgi:predicted sulfurtransferase
MVSSSLLLHHTSLDSQITYDIGGYWVGKNYTFDKRFNHGAKNAVTISECVHCHKPWDRYQAQKKCGICSMEVLFCKECQKIKPSVPNRVLRCPLCKTK